MSLTENFNLSTDAPKRGKQNRKRLPPFSLRLSLEERARLVDEAAGAPLGSYIRAKVLGSALPVRLRRSGLAIEDRAALAQALALLGRSRISNNLNQLAHLANIGGLPMTPETQGELRATLTDVRELRRLLMVALGLKVEAAP